MTQTLLLENDAKLASLYSLNFQIYAGTDVIWKKNLEDAIKVLKVLPQLSLIVSRTKIEGKKSALLLYEYVRKNELQIPFIVLGEDNSLKDNAVVLSEDVELKILIQNVAKMLGVTPKKMVEKIIPDFVPIPIKHFLFINETICDLYVKLSEIPENFHFVKRIPAGEIFSKEFIKRYIRKGLQQLHILKCDRIKFINSFSYQLIDTLEDDKLSMEDRISSTEVAFETVAGLFQQNKVNEENMELAQAGLKSVMTIVSQSGNLFNNLLTNLIDLKTSYLFKHIVIINFLGIRVIKKMHWEKEEHLIKFSFACFFHDIFLENERQAKVKTPEELDLLTDREERDITYEHAWTASQLALKTREIPLEVENIIMQHHGQKNGIGFLPQLTPDHLRDDLSPFSYIFIACEAYGDIIFSEGKNKNDYDMVINKLPEIFKHEKFEKILYCFKDMN